MQVNFVDMKHNYYNDMQLIYVNLRLLYVDMQQYDIQC